MNDTIRWVLSICIPLLFSFVGVYWSSSLTQVRLDERLINLESRVKSNEDSNDHQAKQITANIIAINEVNQGWRTVAKAVDANTTQLTRFTEVLIRLEEREGIRRERDK